MKKILTFFAAAMMLCASVNAQNSGSCGSNATWEFTGNTLSITGTGEITTYSTDMPTAYPWWSFHEEVQTLNIDEGITNIPDWAFAMFENLLTVKLPNSLKSIGNSALEETQIWSISLPEGLETIGHYAFWSSPFTTLCLPSTITFIGEAAFADCADLSSVGCYASVPPTLYNGKAFNNCPAIATVYVQADNVTDYKSAEGWSSFGDKIQSPAGNCGPDGNETKATWAFDMATQTLTLNGTELGPYAHTEWESPGMGGTGGAFNPDDNKISGYPCGIKHLVVGEGIEEIPQSYFYMEIGLVDVVLPSTITSLGMTAFGECFALETITINATTPPTFGDDLFLECPKLAKIIVPTASVATYKTAPGWSAYASLISDGTASPIEELTQPSNIQITKILRNGQVLIIRDGKTYNMFGTEMK